MSDSRNIVLISFDSLRADHCGYMGYDRETTPTLDEMADEGIAFERAISPASRTNPSMAGIFTGESIVFRDKVSNPDISRSHIERYGTIAEDLQELGYNTGAYNPNAYASRYFGFDKGFDHYEDFFFSEDTYQSIFDKHLSGSGLYATFRNLRNFIRQEEVFRTWESYIDDVESWATEEPFFLWIFSLETHFPYLTPRKYRQYSSFTDQYYYNWICNRLIDQFDVNVSDRTWKKIIDIYDDSIWFGDLLLAELRERLAEYDPLFVVIGDHGEAFGEHGTYGHFYPELYQENIHVPWVVWSKDVPSEKISEPISLLGLREMLRAYASTGELTVPNRNRPPIASEYDGRQARNLTGIWSHEVNYVRDQTSRDTQENVATTNGTDPDDKLAEALRAAVSRRTRHEHELLSIREAAENVEKA